MTGVEWAIDALGCDADKLKCLATIQRVCDRVVADLGLHVVGDPQWHRFPGPGGVTLLYLLSESHLAAHTYPELGVATFNLYCCRHREAWDWPQELATAIGCGDVRVQTIQRGEPTPHGQSVRTHPSGTRVLP